MKNSINPNRSLMRWIWIMIILLSTIPLLVMVYVTQLFAAQRIDEEAVSTNSELIIQVRNNIEPYLEHIEKSAQLLSVNNNASAMQWYSYDQRIESEFILDVWKLQKDLQAMRYVNGMIDTILCYYKNNQIILSDIAVTQLSDSIDLRWMEQTTTTDAKWTGFYDGLPKARIKLQFIGERYPDHVCYLLSTDFGWAVFKIDLYKLSQEIDSLTSQISGQITILDQDNRIIYTQLDMQRGEKLTFPEVLEGEGGHFAQSEGSVDSMYYYTIASNGWTYLLSNQRTSFTTLNIHLSRFMIMFTVISSALLVFLAYLIANHIYQPVDRVMHVLRTTIKSGEKLKLNTLDKTIVQAVEKSRALTLFLAGNTQAIQSNILREYLTGRISEDKLIQGLQMCQLPLQWRRYCCVVLRATHPETLIQQYGDMSLWHQLLIDLAGQLDHSVGVCGTSMQDDTIVLMVGYEGMETLLPYMRKLLKTARQQLQLEVTATCGGNMHKLREISTSYEQAMTILAQYTVPGGIVFYKEMLPDEGVELYPTEIQKKLLDAIAEHNLDAACTQLQSFLQASAQRSRHSLELIISDCIRLLSAVLTGTEGNKLGEDSEEIGQFRQLAMCQSLDEIRVWFEKILTTHVGEDSATVNESIRRYAEQTAKYIASSFREDVSMETLADHLDISYSYLRKIFSKMFGCSFSYYLNAARIEEACRLIRETDLTMTEIGQKIGYNNDQNFYRNFKKITGVPPAEFKHKEEGVQA